MWLCSPGPGEVVQRVDPTEGVKNTVNILEPVNLSVYYRGFH